MAVAVLSPWPNTTATVALAAARTCLGDALGLTDESTLDRLGMAAAELVEREAPGAPQAIKNEAVVRMAGYLSQSDFGAIRQESIGPLTVEHALNHGMAFRHCGAKALLAPWRVRRAGAIG